jgi:hypothetical protein
MGAPPRCGCVLFLRPEIQSDRKETTMTDSYNIILDKDTVARIDAWRSQSLFEPSRRSATRALVRMALKVLHKQHRARAAKAAAPAPASDQAVAS